MNPRELNEALHAGRRVYGTLIVSSSPRWPGMVAGLGLDFVFIDTEHVALDRSEVSWMCQTYAALGLPPIVRIPAPDPFMACMALDGGACGVIAPYVETVAQVRALRGAVKLRPLKGRRLEEALRDESTLEPGLRKYLDDSNRDHLLIVNIESRPALENLGALLAEPGIDAVLIGPHDLSCSLGVPERYDDPGFDAAVRDILGQARAAGVGAGLHSWFGVDRLVALGSAGLNLIIHSADILAARDRLGADVAEVRRRLGDRRAAPGQSLSAASAQGTEAI